MIKKETIKKRGRPKGAPTVKRSIALREELNDYLVEVNQRTSIPYNALINMAVEQMMKKAGKSK